MFPIPKESVHYTLFGIEGSELRAGNKVPNVHRALRLMYPKLSSRPSLAAWTELCAPDGGEGRRREEFPFLVGTGVDRGRDHVVPPPMPIVRLT